MKQETIAKASRLSRIGSIILTVIVAGVAFDFYRFIQREQAKADRIHCNNQLKQIGIAFRGFGVDAGSFPMQAGRTNMPGGPPPQ